MDEFKVHRLNSIGLAKADRLADIFEEALDAIREVCANDMKGTGAREMSLVTTKMQEASFFAKRAIALNPENQLGYAPHDIVTDQDESWCRNPGCTSKRSPSCDGRQE